jgi:hypothetical protein
VKLLQQWTSSPPWGGASLCPEHRDSPRVNSGGEPSAQKYYERQSSEPLPLLDWWAYRAVVLRVGPIELDSIRNELVLLIKQYVLRRDRSIEKMRREVETLENYERLEARPVSQFLKTCDFLCGGGTRLSMSGAVPESAWNSIT